MHFNQQLIWCDSKLISFSLSLHDDCLRSDVEEFHSIEIIRSGGGFGFSIRGGAEYNSTLCVLRIAEGGAAENDGRLQVGLLIYVHVCMQLT